MSSPNVTQANSALATFGIDAAEQAQSAVHDLRAFLAALHNVPAEQVSVSVSGSRGRSVRTRIVVEANSG